MQLQMYHPYIEALKQQLNLTQSLIDADILLLLGAWDMRSALLARKARKMGIPYIVCPLGDISERNRKNPMMKRTFQHYLYQKTMFKKASLIIATTPLEEKYITKLAYNKNISLIRYFAYSHLTTKGAMQEEWSSQNTSTLSHYEQEKAKTIATKTQDPIVAQILQIQSRMPHQNIPQNYLDSLNDLLYADNYDENEVNEELSKLKLTNYAAAVFQVMSEKTGLTEGFMPLPAQQGRLSKKIMSYTK